MTLANIVSYGARAAVGNNALQVALCARARKLEPRNCHLRDKRRRPIGICLSAGLSAFEHGSERWVQLAAPALSEAMAEVSHPALPMIAALPEATRPDDEPQVESTFFERLARHSGISFDTAASTLVRRGSAGMAYALRDALARLSAGAPAVIVGGVDSYYHPQVLSWLDEQCRLHSIDTFNGFVPAEGAAFWVLTAADNSSGSSGSGRATADTPWPAARLRLLAARVGDEVVEGDEAPNVAATMSQLVSSMRHDWVLTDNNGERHRVREWSAVALRWSMPLDRQESIADLFGDVGAASGALLGVYVAERLRLSCAPAKTALIVLHSEGAERGVIALEHAHDR